MNIIFRTAEIPDIKQMQVVRHLVKEFYLPTITIKKVTQAP